MTDEQRRPGQVTRRAILGALVVGAAAACGASTGTDGAAPSTTAASGAPEGTTPATTAAASTATTGDATSSSSSAPTSSTSTSRSSSTTGKGSTTTTAAEPAAFVVRGPDGSDRVALTFHTNGDLKLAQRLLDAARDGDAVLTSFIVGNWLEQNPSWAAKLLDAGHELANHTYTHPNFTSLGPQQMVSEITRCRDVIAKLHGGDGGRYFRPSGTDDGKAVPSEAILRAARTAGYETVLGWDVEPFDYQDPGEDAVRTRVLDQIRGGSIVSLHFGHPGTIDALPAILDGLRSRNLHPVTVSTLLGS